MSGCHCCLVNLLTGESVDEANGGLLFIHYLIEKNGFISVPITSSIQYVHDKSSNREM